MRIIVIIIIPIAPIHISFSYIVAALTKNTLSGESIL